MKPSESLRAKIGAVRGIVARIGATNLRVFGSVVHGEDREDSDLDLLVDVPRGTTLPDLVETEHALSEELGVDVDLLTPDDLHPRIRERVLLEARPL
ncbi:MAG: nucleotidyltransferase family protein [Alphaproteobacteria bacterium]|nr:nucleotidyltransferase family protein [Alphaproteobacteria bacterium]